ncbi:MAG: translation initiation factor IF-6 [Candidatus Nanohaloarchaeota archaeon QJJ-7]|nr:translation initiation factor IF-6 [Candidatus Nanohaloarchaeota archaeon QJJ-7]
MTVGHADYQGDVNIGFFGIVTEETVLLAEGFKKSEFFGDSQDIRLAGTDLIGIFAAGNSNGVLVPEVITEHEEEVLEEKGIDFKVLETDYTALGNLVLCNDNGCFISKNLEDRKEEISEFLDVPVESGTVAGLDIPGSCGAATENGVLLHRNASETELRKVEEALQAEGDVGTVNFGSPYVHSGVLADSEDLLVGNDTTGPEVQRIQESLDLL